MKNLKAITVLLVTCVGSVGLHAQTKTLLGYLPDNAKMVIKINPGRLQQKIQWADLLKYKLVEDLLKKTSDKAREILDHPEHSGIDLSEGLFLVAYENKDHKKPGAVLYGIPKDTAQLAATVKKLNPGKKISMIPNGRLIIGNNAAIAWNRDIFILASYDSARQSPGQNVPGKLSAEATKTKQLTEECKTLITKRRSPFNNETFTSLLQEEGDLLLWINNTVGSQSLTNNKVPAAFGMLNRSLMRQGNYSAGIINFESGKVVMKMKQYIPASLDSVYEKYPLQNVNPELIRKLPAGHPIFVLSFRVSPEMIRQTFASTGADKLVDSISHQKAKLEDLLHAVKGDALLAVMKADEVADEDSVTRSMNGIQFFIAGSIDDKEKFRDFAALVQNGKKDSAQMKRPQKMKPLVLSNDSMFVVSLSQVAAKKFLDAPGSNLDMEKVMAPYADNPSALIIDLKTIFAFATQSMLKNKSQEETKRASQVLGMFDKLVSYGGRHETRSISTTTELILTDQDKNSLVQFMDLLNLFYSLRPKSSTAALATNVPTQAALK